jgi:2-hydroxy-6-oxo-6-(2'-carboxyphenyl)-hexa-2,4-dienoate hydrolase
MDRGERKAFIVCGEKIPSNYTLRGLSEANITSEYEQHIGMCSVGIDTPGLYLILKAQDDATTASVSIVNADTKEPVCGGLSIAVPERVHIGQASLEDLAGPGLPLKILTITADKSSDLSQACVEGLTFPEGKWPSLSPLSREDAVRIPAEVKSSFSADQPVICTKSSIKALVKVRGQQRYPAKIVISKVALEGGREKEGVAYATLPPPEWLSAMKDEDAKYVDVNGIRTRYFDKGKGDALLLVHGGQAGSTSNAQNWEQNFDYLARYFHVYAIDKLGMGYTDNPKTDEDYKNYYQGVVDHVYGFMKAVGMEKVHLVGHSQGGWPVTRIALDHPEMVKSLVIEDSGTIAPSGAPGRSMSFMAYNSSFIDPPGGATIESVRRGAEFWSYSMNNITDEKVEREHRLSQLPKMIEAGKQMGKHSMSPGHPVYRALKKKALEDIKAGKLKMPTRVMWGYNDPSSTYEVGIELFRYVSGKVPGSGLLLFDECGHSPYIEYPELFNRTIKSFCGAHSSPPID